MSISRHSDDQMHAREEVLLPLSILGFVLASVVMGWCLFDHQRPNMPRATVMSDSGTPRQ
ncbi:MAG TPA: hypothetical protein PKE16_15850 [Hyphomicrobium sp.]|nr:hypothetical protein [Hyphomicrobium sp.]